MLPRLLLILATVTVVLLIVLRHDASDPTVVAALINFAAVLVNVLGRPKR
jgi:hypothetical protein